jgi:hypothetical protein
MPAQALANLVVDTMGGKYDSIDTMAHFWQAESQREKQLRRCVRRAIRNKNIHTTQPARATQLS